MMIKDPKHVHKHRLVMIFAFIGIIIVFGVWAVQIKQMFAERVAGEMVQNVDPERSAATQNYLDQLDILVPGIEATFGDVIRQQEQEIAKIQAQEDSEDLLADELMKRFQEQTVVGTEEGVVDIEAQEVIQ